MMITAQHDRAKPPATEAPVLDRGIAGIGRALRAGEVSAEALTQACIARIRERDPGIFSFLTIAEEHALSRARIADEEIASGIDRGPLHGIPFSAKDNIDTAGIRTTSNSRVHAERVPATSAAVIERVNAAGGILIGKTACWEFAVTGPSLDLPWPMTRNPWNRDHLPGGSSSGCGAAVAAGLVPCSLGTDSGGSIRFPSASCGLAGLKPTYGRVSRSGVYPHGYTFDTAGPLARTVEDCALMLEVVAGHDPESIGSIDEPVPRYAAALSEDIRGLRLGLVRHWYADVADPEIVKAVDEAAERLASLGAEIEEIALDPLEDFVATKVAISHAEMFAIHEREIKARPGDFGKLPRTRIMTGALLSAQDYVRAQRQRSELAKRTMAHFDRFDALLTPGWATLADRADPAAGSPGQKHPMTMPFSVTGLPALVIPCGFSSSGLPISLQIAGRPFDEASVLRIGHTYERATGWHLRRPSFQEVSP
ncbi:amidase [Bosea sp. ASV33]|uniref:amidase n=1 Tax=Bosea sp. ASV33 TaxID=2795106 RepID=UPI0018EE45C8|nr:amidase [Bosea sp. ASV33]